MSRNKWYIGVCAVLFSVILSGVGFMLGRQSSSAEYGTSSYAATSMESSTTLSTTTRTEADIEEAPVSTNFTVTSVQYPLVETPLNTNPPEENPDMQIQFTDSASVVEAEKLRQICPLEFRGGTKFCVDVDIITDVDDPYRASVRLSIEGPVPGCSDFGECFEALHSEEMCQSFLEYLDSLVRDLVTHGYNSDGLNNLDPTLVRQTYWDGNGENRQLEFGADCSVVATQL